MEGSESLETTTVTSLSVNCIVQFVNGDKAEKTWNYIMKNGMVYLDLLTAEDKT